MQKLPYEDFEYHGTCFADITTTSLYEEETTLQSLLNTPDDFY